MRARERKKVSLFLRGPAEGIGTHGGKAGLKPCAPRDTESKAERFAPEGRPGDKAQAEGGLPGRKGLWENGAGQKKTAQSEDRAGVRQGPRNGEGASGAMGAAGGSALGASATRRRRDFRGRGWLTGRSGACGRFRGEPPLDSVGGPMRRGARFHTTAEGAEETRETEGVLLLGNPSQGRALFLG